MHTFLENDGIYALLLPIFTKCQKYLFALQRSWFWRKYRRKKTRFITQIEMESQQK